MKKEFQVASDLSEVQAASDRVLAFLRPLSLSEGVFFDIRLCLEEAIINAIKYGNRFKKELPVRVAVDCDEERLEITVEDKGPGFDVKAIADCTQGSNLLKGGGRGIHLIRQLMDEARFNDKGNRLVMVKSLKNNKQGG